MNMDVHDFVNRANANEDFSSSSQYFDGIILMTLGSLDIWMKVFMGQIIAVSETAFPFGCTFSIKGSASGWKFALDPEKNRFREALYGGRIQVQGNTLEFSRVSKAVHGLTETLRDMAGQGLITFRDQD